ncbi:MULTISPECIES: hypothetical protein [unclassified Microcoleus]|uniref:hypothetical protein n=1 Tax=unclassified Microcoleus TaxID=2642155 RepID=UPI002FD56FC3
MGQDSAQSQPLLPNNQGDLGGARYVQLHIKLVSGGGVEREEMDYTVAVPSANQPRVPRDRGFSFHVESSVFDRAPRSKFAEKRGTLGGC